MTRRLFALFPLLLAIVGATAQADEINDRLIARMTIRWKRKISLFSVPSLSRVTSQMRQE